MPKQLGKYWIAKVDAQCSVGCAVYEGCDDPASAGANQETSFMDMGASLGQNRSVRRESSSAAGSDFAFTPTARVKAYDREVISLPTLSANIKLQESLARRRYQLRLRYAQVYAARHGGDPAAVAAALLHRGSHGMALESTSDPLEVTVGSSLDLPNTSDMTDEAVPFLYLSSEHVLLLKDKMQSRSKIILIRDWMPDNMVSIISHGRLPEEGAFFYFFQLLQAVYFLHSYGIAHRNIAAEHLHLTADGAVLRLGGMSASIHMQAGAANAPADLPPPGSYGLCSHCSSPVPIVADVSRLNSTNTNTTSSTTSSSTAATPSPGVNTLMTTCRRCGVQQNRMQLLRTLTGSPGYLAPEVLAYRPPASSLMSSQVPPGSLMTSMNPMSSFMSAAPATAPGVAGQRSALEEAQARDVWSCGVVLFFMLTATLPFDPAGQAAAAAGTAQTDFRRTPEEIDDTCARIVACQYQIPSYVSDSARQLIASLLQHDASRRPTVAQVMSYACLAQARATLTQGM